MPRISGVDVPDQKKVAFSLRSIFGIGQTKAEEIVKLANIDPDKRARDLTGDEIGKIQRLLDKVMVEGDLRRMIRDNIDRLRRIRSYRGMRHSAQLPVRGQRTRSNARTNRGKRRTVGSMTKEMAAKLDAQKNVKK